jgi:hypothetical protein
MGTQREWPQSLPSSALHRVSACANAAAAWGVGIACVDEVAFATEVAGLASNPIAQKMTNEPGFIDLPL